MPNKKDRSTRSQAQRLQQVLAHGSRFMASQPVSYIFYRIS